MDPNIAQNEPTVIKLPIPFYKSLPFLAGGGILVFIVLSFSLYNLFKIYSAKSTTQIVQEKQEKPLKGLTGIVQTVDINNNMLTIKEKDKTNSYQVSNDVLISQLVLGIKRGEEMKQFSLPTEIFYLEDLAKKKGSEVYLVFDSNDQKVIQIQMYPKER